MRMYISLPGGVIEPCDDLLKWSAWYVASGSVMFDNGGRRVAREAAGDANVSTVFLSLNHSYSGGLLLFETMIFGGAHDGFQRRYATVEEARAGHAEAVALARG